MGRVLFDPAAHKVASRRSPQKIAVLSIDVEHDYNGGRSDALDRYDMHMVDLVPDGRIGKSPLPLWLKGAHALVRHRQRGFDDLAALGERLRARGYEWTTLSHCHERLTGRDQCKQTAT